MLKHALQCWLSGIILAFLPRYQAMAQVSVAEIEQNKQIDLSPQTYLYLDSTGTMTFANITQQAFKPLAFYQMPIVQNNQSRYWLRFSLKNPTDDTLHLVFTAGYHYLMRLHDGSSAVETSLSLRYKQRPVPIDAKYVPISLLPHTHKSYYVLLEDNTLHQVEIHPLLLSYTHAEHLKLNSFYEDTHMLSINYAVVSILFFMAVFSLLQYVFSRQRYFLYYAFYLFSIYLFCLWGFSFSAHLSNLMTLVPALKFSLRQNFYVLITNYFYYLFIAEFLQLNNTHKPLGRVLYLIRQLILVLLAVELCNTFLYRNSIFATYVTIGSQIFLSISGIIASIYVLQIPGRAINFIKIGSVSLLIGALFGFLTKYLHVFPKSTDLFPHYPNHVFSLMVLFEILCFSLGVTYKFLEYIHEKATLQRKIAESSLDVLRLQINPHFIFNSLNSIKSYILKERIREAANYLTEFAQLFRVVLNQSQLKTISLQEELETLKLYVSLEQKRLQNQFEFVLNVASQIDTTSTQIPTLLLQPFVENAIKHGLAPKKSDGQLRLSFWKENDTLICQIEDNGVGRSQAQKTIQATQHRSMGLKIISERLRLLKTIHNWNIHLEIADKFEAQKPAGTLVTLRISQY